MDIQATRQPDGWWVAIDADTYDCDCDERGFFTTSPTAYGNTKQEAIDNLLAGIEDRAARGKDAGK